MDLSLLDHLTERDVRICTDIYEHRFLTSPQIFQLHFESEYRARYRALQLFQAGVLNRFRPPVYPGSLPWHYLLDKAGAEIVSGVRSTDPSRYFDRNRPAKLARSNRLTHIREVNDFFCRLAYASRNSGGRLTNWLGEFSSAKECARLVFPDGIATLQFEDASVRFFFELDRATERDEALRRKLWQYDQAVTPDRHPGFLLFTFSSDRRESSARNALRSQRLTVLTSTQSRHQRDPFGTNWWPIDGEGRLPLSALNALRANR